MAYKVSQRRACAALVFIRSVIRYESRADPQTALRMRLRELAMARVGYGYRRLHILLWREGWRVNHKRVYRLYRDDVNVKYFSHPRGKDISHRHGKDISHSPLE